MELTNPKHACYENNHCNRPNVHVSDIYIHPRLPGFKRVIESCLQVPVVICLNLGNKNLNLATQ